MKHNYRTCDCCGKMLGIDGDKFYRIKNGLVFGTFHPADGFQIDICHNCWGDIQDYVKEKRNNEKLGWNATMA